MPMALNRAHKSLTPSCQKAIAEERMPSREDPKATDPGAACQCSARGPEIALRKRRKCGGVSDGIRTRDLQGHNLAL